MRRSRWDFVDPVPWSETSRDIAFIRDLDGPVSVTNDAEAVFEYIQQQWPTKTRVVYQDTDGEWWEMYISETRMGRYMQFRPWYGAVWDRLSRVES